MRKKELAEWLDDMAEAIDRTRVVPIGAPLTEEEADAIRCGIIAGLCEAAIMARTGCSGSEGPRKQAQSLLIDAMRTYTHAHGKDDGDE